VSSESVKERWLRTEACEARYSQAGDPAALREALGIMDELLQEASPDAVRFRQLTRTKVGGLRMRLYRACGDLADLDRARDLFQETVDRAEGTEEEPAGYLNNLGVCLRECYESRGDAADLRRSLEVLERALRSASADFPKISELLGNLGVTRRDLHKVEGDPFHLMEAVRLLEEAVAKSPAGSPDLPVHLTNLGLARLDLYDRMGARAALGAALQALEKSVAMTPPGSPQAAIRRNNLGMALGRSYARTGDLQELAAAAEHFGAAVLGLPKNAPARPRYLDNFGTAAIELSQRTGDRTLIDFAIRSYLEALKTAPEESPEMPRLLSGAAQGLSRKHEVTGDPRALEHAISLFREALRRSSPEAPERSRLLANLAACLEWRFASTRASGDLDEAVHLQREGLALLSAHSPDRPRHLHNLAVSLQQRFQLGGGPEEREEAVALFRSTSTEGLETYPEVALGSARAWGDWASQLGDWRQAAEAYGCARRAIDRLLEAQLVRPARESWLRDAQTLPSREAFARLQIGDLAGGVLALEEGSARLLAESLNRQGAALRALAVSRPGLLSAYREVVEKVSAIERGWVLEARRPSDLELAARLRAARAEMAAVVSEIRQVAGFEGLLAAPTLARVRQAVEPSEADVPQALVYLAASPAGALALIVTSEGLDGLELRLTGKELARLFEGRGGEGGGYLDGLLGLDPEERRRWLDEGLAWALPVLGERVIGPVASRLRRLGIERVALLPAGLLALLPLHSAGTPPLVETWAVSYAPNAASLAAARAELRVRHTGVPRLVGVGNPLPHPQPLEGARSELEAVSSLFEPEGRWPLYEEAATRSALLERLPCGSHLHFACHGRFDASAPLASRLELAGGETLTLEELLRGPVRLEGVRLAVLSACQTAVRDMRSLPDELIGLPAGFLEAGVPGVVGTLWPVDDIATTLLMVRFYLLLLRGDPDAGSGPLAPAQALRRAQLWLRDLTAGGLANQLAPPAELADLLGPAVSIGIETLCMLREDPEEKLFTPRDWGAFVFFGA
jgi:CHAT domain-containing protein